MKRRDFGDGGRPAGSRRSDGRWPGGRRLLLALWVVLVVGCFMSSVAAEAQESVMQAQSSARYTFGQSMQFALRAKSESMIQGATLFFNTPEMDGTFTVDFEIEPARELTLEHEVALTQVQLAPFTVVRYWWRLATEDGTEVVAEQRLDYVDDRFQWQSVTQSGVEVYWTGEDRTLGQTALDVLARAQPNIESILPAEVAPLRIYIYPGMADLRSALRLTGRDWVGAEAMPELGLVLVTAVNPRTAALDLGQSIPHELSHLLLYRTTGAQYENTPRWFDEGLATVLQLTPDSSHGAILQEAIEAGATMPFAALCEAFPAAEAEARLAYAQSAAMVAYIQQEFGLQVLRELVQAYADGAGCEGGVQRVLGRSMAALEAEWLAREKPASPLAEFLRMNGLWMALAGGGFLLMALLLVPLHRERR